MGWRCVTVPFQQGLRLTSEIQKAFLLAYQIHLAGGGGLLSGAGVFTRASYRDQTYQFYFSPEALQLLGTVADSLKATSCDQPKRRLPDDGRWEGLALSVGEASAWDMLQASDEAPQ